MTDEQIIEFWKDKQAIDIELLINDLPKFIEIIQKQKEEIEKKNKQIDLMAEEILYENNCSGKLDFEIYKDKEEVIKDFERKVKNEN